MLPPEVLDPTEFGSLDYRIDIYHCGLLFLHLAHSHELFFTEDEFKAGAPRELAMHLPPPFNTALGKALRRHVLYRTASAMDLWQDLNPLEEQIAAPVEQLELNPPPQTEDDSIQGGQRPK